MKIDEILQAWEEKQKVHAQAIEEQKQKDDERLEKEREAARKRQEEEQMCIRDRTICLCRRSGRQWRRRRLK